MMRSLVSLLLFLSLASLSLSTSLKETNGLKEDKCEYTILVKTGTRDNAGTDAIVSLKLAGPGRDSPDFFISNLESWGSVMESGRNFNEKGQMDVSQGTGPCLPKPPCWMLLSHDNTGDHPGWYVDYVEVFTFPTGPSTEGWFQHFTVNQWLALDENPKQLYAERNNCGNGKGHIIKLNSEV